MGELKPNGHALAMAEAFQGMIHDTVKPMIDGLDEKMNSRMDVLEKHMDAQIETTNKNVQAQLAQHRENIAADFNKALRPSG